MGHAQQLPDIVLDTIAQQVGKLYPSLVNDVTQLQRARRVSGNIPHMVFVR